MSTWSSCSMEEVSAASPNSLRWFQLYIMNDRKVSQNLVQRAEKNGYKAIIVTVDGVAHGRRYRNLRNKFTWPSNLPPKNFDAGFMKGTSEIGKDIDSSMDQSVTWKDIDWLRSITDLPIIIKGILTVEMALEAVEHGVAAIVVSNHGGRRLDSTLPAIHALPQIAKAVNGRCEIYFDSGIRNGGDVAKAIALGAKAVFVGRPIIWGLACGGEKGAEKVLEILRDEFEVSMKLLGVTSIAELQSVPDLVIHESKISSRL
uniref:hydroxyacid oxidase 1-like n=1 Tax=Styela clava TaxID=7725 RepID=UPI00193A0B11|nr:hydroxyacid oxidase 1-like [Styela clava]